MILVLCEDHDSSAFWAARALQLRGLNCRVVTGSELANANGWTHRVGATGARCSVRLPRTLDLGRVRGVLNRLPYVPATWVHRIGGADRDYAIEELRAFYLSFLHALPGPMLNQPTPQGLSGNWRHPSAWTALAVRAGLPVRPYRQTSDDDPNLFWQAPPAPTLATVHVVGGRALRPEGFPAALESACAEFSKVSATKLLGLDFARDEQGVWELIRTTVMPELVSGGAALADALAEALSA